VTEIPPTVAAWHTLVESRDATGLPALLDDDIVFRSPAVHTPQAGRALATAYLEAALAVLGPHLEYQREWYAEDSAVLEFSAVLDGITVHGVDLLRWNADGRLVDFTVMVRPLKGLQHLITLMAAELSGKS
jgi:hypothetical protein